jgi:hypothetical protein
MSSAPLYDPFDRSNGNGSRSAEEDWLDENTTSAENQWSTAETTFYYWEASSAKKKQFERFYDWHHGKGEGDRRTTLRRSNIVTDAETFVNVLELREPQSLRVVEIAKELDFSSNRFGGKPYEKILLAIISLVSDQELSQRLNHQNLDSSLANQRIVLDDTFRDLMEANNLGSREHNRIRQMLREKTEEFE